jgi:hypothetical protein
MNFAFSALGASHPHGIRSTVAIALSMVARGARRSGAGSKLIAKRHAVIARLTGTRCQNPSRNPALRQVFRVFPGRHGRDRQRYPLQA